MAKTKPERTAKLEEPTTPPRFEPGAKVRVKRGVTDPDFPDIPLGGWAGTVKKDWP